MPRPKKTLTTPITTTTTMRQMTTRSETRSAMGLRSHPGGVIQDTAENYEEVSLIGSGAYGTVYKAKDLAHEGQFVALKKVRVPLTEEGVPLGTLREITLLKHIEAFEHPNVVRLLDICHGPRLPEEQQLILYLVFEHVDYDLATYLERCPPPEPSPEKIKDILHQILSGIDFLHCNRIVHRDLKPQNILITSTGLVKVADFGLARLFQNFIPLTDVVVTLWYRAPEVLLNATYASAVDIWSCGCIFAELYNRSPLFRGQSEADQLRKIFEILGTPDESGWPEVPLQWVNFKGYRRQPLENLVSEITPEGLDLLQKMLLFDPLQRITAKDAMHHSYFQNIGRQGVYKTKKTRKTSVSRDTEASSSHTGSKK